MCRFVAYFGKEPIILDEIIAKPVNSLVNQSKQSREGLHCINADGFGIGWYNLDIETKPGLFKSIRPAWNDENLHNLSAKLKSNCFIGHVRASTVGDITHLNCHPFAIDEYLFAHNGTIKDFNLIKQELIKELNPESFLKIKGQTDSEHFFGLIHSFLDKNKPFLESAKNAILTATKKIQDLKNKISSKEYTRLNIILTNGTEMIAMRYSYPQDIEPLSLYYAIGKTINHSDILSSSVNFNKDSLLIASEPLTDFTNEWHEIKNNNIVTIDKNSKMNFYLVNESSE